MWALRIALMMYVVVYVGYRSDAAEVWPKNDETYVMYSDKGLYYIFRPLAYLDYALTGMQSHFGPHT